MRLIAVSCVIAGMVTQSIGLCLIGSALALYSVFRT